jgi:hypothetical protein
MFGLENQNKKKKQEEFFFDLEIELRARSKYNELKGKVDEKVQRVKGILRSGEAKEDFDRFGSLLQGYTSVQKVMSRITTK